MPISTREAATEKPRSTCHSSLKTVSCFRRPSCLSHEQQWSYSGNVVFYTERWMKGLRWMSMCICVCVGMWMYVWIALDSVDPIDLDKASDRCSTLNWIFRKWWELFYLCNKILKIFLSLYLAFLCIIFFFPVFSCITFSPEYILRYKIRIK